MALPTKTDLEKMDWAYKGQPFVDVPAKSSINIKTMDYVYRAQPFVSNPCAFSYSVLAQALILSQQTPWYHFWSKEPTHSSIWIKEITHD